MSYHDPEPAHMASKARDAKVGGFNVLSTGGKLAVTLALNRADWLALIPQAARFIRDEDEA